MSAGIGFEQLCWMILEQTLDGNSAGGAAA